MQRKYYFGSSNTEAKDADEDDMEKNQHTIESNQRDSTLNNDEDDSDLKIPVVVSQNQLNTSNSMVSSCTNKTPLDSIVELNYEASSDDEELQV